MFLLFVKVLLFQLFLTQSCFLVLGICSRVHSQSSQASFSSFARVSGACLHTARNLALCNVINIKFNDVGSSFIGSQVKNTCQSCLIK